MLKNKILSGLLITGLTVIPALASEILPEIEFPKPPSFRVGISELPEKQYIQAEEDKSAKVEKSYAKVDNSQDADIADYTYADLDLKRMSKEVSQELEYEGPDMLSDLSLLWQGAAMQSETINFALYKLANPDADKPDEKSIKKVLTTIASMSTLVGAGIGNPVIAGTSLISGNVLGIMTQDTKALNYKYTKVNDADMIILIRKVEDLQQKTVDLYYDYMSAKKQVEFISDMVSERKQKFEYAQANNAPRELIVITDAYYRTAMDKLRNAQSEFFSKRAALEQFVGNETLLQFEQELTARENGEKTASAQTPEEQQAQNEEYSQTVQQVENYTKNNQSAVQSSTVPVTTGNTAATADTIQLRGTEQPALNIAQNNSDINPDKVTGLSSNLSDDEINSPENKQTTKKKKFGFGKSKSKNNETSQVNQETETVTGSESSTTAENDKTSKISDRKAKKLKEKEEKAAQKAEKKKSKINQNLIFLHGQDPKQAGNSVGTQNAVQQQPAVNTIDNSGLPPLTDLPKVNSYKKIDTSGLPPLDEIKVPQMGSGGYSIHNDYSSGEYYDSDSVQF